MNKLIKLTAAGDGFTGEFACNLAALGETTVHALSCAGDHTAIRFLHAAMRDQGSVKFRFAGMDNVAADVEFISQRSYEVRIAHLGYDCWHLLALDDSGQFLLHDDEETLWTMLRSERFTTPLLRSWMPKVQEALRQAGFLKGIESHGCTASLLVADTASLDGVVSDGLRRRTLQIQSH